MKNLFTFAALFVSSFAIAQTTKTLVKSVGVQVGDTLNIETNGNDFAVIYADIKTAKIEQTVTVAHPKHVSLANALVKSGRYDLAKNDTTIFIETPKPVYASGFDVQETRKVVLTVPVGVVVVVK